jgi:ssRNA-specific RNase YbeY (16S rRNA maturation enzyme)
MAAENDGWNELAIGNIFESPSHHFSSRGVTTITHIIIHITGYSHGTDDSIGKML